MPICTFIKCGILAQSVEHMTFNHGVPGSNPGCLIFIYNCDVTSSFTLYIKDHADVAELADALDLGSSGRPCRFNSCHPQLSKRALIFKALLHIIKNVLMLTVENLYDIIKKIGGSLLCRY